MKVEIEEEDVSHMAQLDEGSRVEDALKKVGINKETVLVEKDGRVVSSQEELDGGDVLDTILVVSMG